MLAKSHGSLPHALRESLFQVVSVQTTTGFVSADFDTWNTFAKMVLLLLMFVGGCAGSTAGGMKVVRFLLLAKNAKRVLSQASHPDAVIPVKLGRRWSPAHHDRRFGVFVLYIAVYVIGTLLVATTGVGLVTAGTAVATTLNNVGPGLELVGPMSNFALIAPFGKVVLIVMMLVGRLELLAVLLPFTRTFWSR